MADQDKNDGIELYRSGRYIEAYPFLLDAESNGYLDASFCLAFMLEKGLGTTLDIHGALTRYKKIRDAGAPVGAYHAGLVLEKLGRFEEAVENHKFASERNYVASSYAIYRLWKMGRKEVQEQDAQEYFENALSGGHVYAKRDRVHMMLKGKFGLLGIIRALPLFIHGVYETAMLRKNDPHSSKLH